MESDIIHSIDKYLSGTADEAQKAAVEALFKKLMSDNKALTPELTDEELKNVSAKMWKEIQEFLLLAFKETIGHI